METYQRRRRMSSILPTISLQVSLDAEPYCLFVVSWTTLIINILFIRTINSVYEVWGLTEVIYFFSAIADWIIADMLAIRQNALGHVRYVLKDGLKWLPLYGWYFSQVLFAYWWYFISLKCYFCKSYWDKKQVGYIFFFFWSTAVYMSREAPILTKRPWKGNSALRWM